MKPTSIHRRQPSSICTQPTGSHGHVSLHLIPLAKYSPCPRRRGAACGRSTGPSPKRGCLRSLYEALAEERLLEVALRGPRRRGAA
ncbi:hypothetical protein CesoFtcFv8_026408 [Champsocephalus esox]|uniref:Uncharacterized protein n=1 Tax=Champsocephalus esox TaxID=159716 RepID=A0AAN8B2S9_9TELE|nr:hypothetical protein CesoFtcFv8_026408 [Champsocephalus esox]